MAISSLLDIAWDHAYWTEGPEFVAAAPSSSGGLRVGVMSLDAGGETKISLWPDEVGTADATQASSASQPYYSPSSATLNGKPVVHGLSTDSIDRNLAASFSSISLPYDVVVIGRMYVTSAMYFYGGSTRFGAIVQSGDPAPRWNIDTGNGFPTPFGSFADTTAHLFRIRAQAGADALWVDEVSDISASAGNASITDLMLLNTPTNSGALKGEVAFYGVKAGGLSAGDASDLHTYCQSHYGTA